MGLVPGIRAGGVGAGSLLVYHIVPLFAGIYKKGAGLGPTITFLFFAPAANILALVYTGGVIGVDLAVARLLLSLTFGIGIGLIMALIFNGDDVAHDAATNSLFGGKGQMHRAALLFLLVLVVLLLAGTLKIGLLTDTYGHLTLPVAGMDRFQAMLTTLVPFDASKGEEGVTAQGAILIGLLILIGLTAWRGLENIHEGATAWTWTALGMVSLTLLVASVRMNPTAQGLEIALTGKMVGVLLSLATLAYLARRHLSRQEL